MENYLSWNHPVDAATNSSRVPSRFNTGYPNDSEGHGLEYSRARSVSRTLSSESGSEQGFLGGNLAFRLRSKDTTSSDANPLDDNEGHETRLTTSEKVRLLSRSCQVRHLIQYLQKAPSTAQKLTRVRNLIEGCNGPAPPSSEKLWARLECLVGMILYLPPDSAELRE